jgi:hypothetical protein
MFPQRLSVVAGRRQPGVSYFQRPARTRLAATIAGRALAACLMTLLLLVIGTGMSRATVARAALTQHCRDVGPANTDVGLYHITANRISCGKARGVLRRWYYDRSAPNSGPRGWRCSTRQTSSFSSRTTCERRRARIGFTQFSA